MSGISQSGWITILVALCTLLFSAIAWLIKRLVSRIDGLELSVFGETGVKERLNKYVTHEGMEQRLTAFNEQMRGLRDEGEKREERILAAISNQTLVIGSEVREIKQDIREQNTRIDRLMSFGNPNNR